MQMLRSYAALWYQRFVGNIPLPEPLVHYPEAHLPYLACSKVECSPWFEFLNNLHGKLFNGELIIAKDAPVSVRDIPPSAVDFHCSNMVCSYY